MPKLDKEKHEQFCQHYVVSRNATKAAQAAGYAEGSAYNQGYMLLKRPEIQDRIAELSGEITTNIDVISELEKQYEHAKINGHGQTALKALELLARARGNNQDDVDAQDVETLENNIKNAMYVVGKEKIYKLLMETFPEDFVDDEQLEAVAQVMEEDKEILEQLDD
jgi:phage terminase small subunit